MNPNPQDEEGRVPNEYDDRRNNQYQSFDCNGQDSLYPAKWDLSGLFPPPVDDEPAEPESTDGGSLNHPYAQGNRFPNLSDSLYFSAPTYLNRLSNN